MIRNTSEINCSLSDSDYSSQLIEKSFYAINGASGILLNTLVLLCILPTKHLHTILLAALTMMDLLNSFAYCAYAFRWLVVAHMAPFFMTPFQCVVQGFHITFFEIAEASTSWLTTFITIDRLIAVVWFQRYRTLGYKYVTFIFLFVSTYILVDVVASWIGSYFLEEVKKFAPHCDPSEIVPGYYYSWHNIQMITCGYLSIFIYVCAIVAMKIKKTNVSSSVHDAHEKRERTVTKRVARIVLLIFFLQILPITIYVTDLGKLAFFNAISPYAWDIYSLTPSVNAFIYYSANPDFRSKLNKLLCRTSNQVGPAIGRG